MLGTGNATVTECYNTCFVIEDNGELLLVDGGGGNTILQRLKAAGYKWQDVRKIFVTHKHIDHLLGIIWMVRMITQNMKRGKYDGEAYIYGHDEVLSIIRDMASQVLAAGEVAYIDKRLHLVEVKDGEEFVAAGNRCVAFDIRSTKAKQFGFTMYYGDGKKLTCCGDEPYNECEFEYANNSDWLLHEAFCLYSQADVFAPYEKHHSTAKDACELAAQLKAKNVVLYHTEDKNIRDRKALYTAEGATVYDGNIVVPDDMEVIEID